jgi:acyl-CoA thioesterase FadM
VNNVNYIRHFESARIALFMTIAHLANPTAATLTGDLPDEHFLSGRQIGPILRNVSCRYTTRDESFFKLTNVMSCHVHVTCVPSNRFKHPVVWPDYVTVGTRIEDIQSDRLTLRHITVSHRHGRVVAEGDDTCVIYDYRTLSKAALPDNLRDIMQRFFYVSPSSTAATATSSSKHATTSASSSADKQV